MPSPLFDLTGKIALITGSGRGIGFIIARGMAEAGATIVLNGLSKEQLSGAVANLSDEGFKAYGFPFDVTQSSQIAQQVKAIEQQIGPIDILHNNAGIHLRGDLAEIEESVWRKVIETNLTSAFLVSREVVKGMIQRRRGKIIHTCSLMSEVGRITTGAYAAAKGGLKMLTKAMCVDWAKHNIQVNGIGPGYFITDMTQVLADNPDFDGWLKKRTPSARWGDPKELIGAAIFLASEASNFVNGQVIYVDGGILASL